MYGLLLESLQQFIEKEFGPEMWEMVREQADLKQASFHTRVVYQDALFMKMVETFADVACYPVDTLLYQNGRFFINYLSQYGYDKMLRVLGRTFGDFIRGLDNLHDYLRFSYPKIKPPSFVVDSEDETGIRLHYVTKRPGLASYVMGQLTVIAETLYDMSIDIDLISQESTQNLTTYTFELKFDNHEFVAPGTQTSLDQFHVRNNDFFDFFPFHMIVNKNMEIVQVGLGMNHLSANLVGFQFQDKFELIRPYIEKNFSTVSLYQRVKQNL